LAAAKPPHVFRRLGIARASGRDGYCDAKQKNTKPTTGIWVLPGDGFNSVG